MFRAILLYLSNARWARSIVTNWGLARRISSRFVVGESLDDALQRVSDLNTMGLSATLDHLGENVSNAEEALHATDTYIAILQSLDDVGAASGASLKLTQLGLGLDFELCLSNMRCIAARAKEFNTFVRIDMEDSSTVDDTLRIYRTLREEGLENLGVVIQSYLYRSEDDVRSLLQQNGNIRLCKGAYKELPDVAFPDKKDVDDNFDRLTALMIDQALTNLTGPRSHPGKIPPMTAIASHDEKRIDFAKQYAKKVGLPQDHLEFQMLNGIRPDLQTRLAEEGFPVRVYVPYGTEWYPYFMRRLAERPANVWFFISNFFQR